MLGEVTPLFDREAYCDMVEKAKRYIREGDIFQIVLSNRLSAPFEGSLLNTYRVLRTINPSPYMFYFSGTDVEVAGASPETLVKLDDGVLHTHTHALFAFEKDGEHRVRAGHLKATTVLYTAEIELRPVVGGSIGYQRDPETGTGFWKF